MQPLEVIETRNSATWVQPSKVLTEGAGPSVAGEPAGHPPMADVLEKICLDQATKAVLLSQPSSLRPVFQLMLAHESGEWESAAALSGSLHLDSEDVAGYYWQAQQWAREVSSGG